MKEAVFLSFWSVNDTLEVNKACGQLDEMRRLGLQGVVFHPRNYPDEPEYLGSEYMARLSRIILHAKKLDMEFWLYDENGFPSGAASGRVLREDPEVRSRWLEYRDGQVLFRERREISALDERGVRAFIRITFDGYKNGLAPEAFDAVTGFFSDEVSFQTESAAIRCGGVPWCQGLEERYLALYGEPIRDKLPLLFEDGEGCETVRVRFWELISELLAERFYGPVNDWCRQNGKRYTAHLKAEENMFFGMTYHGSPYRVLRRVDMPAVDALERYPGNHYYPHIASSLARQFGDGECSCEAMGGAGWGVTPEDLVRYMGWLSECGIRRFILHIAQYSLKAQAIRDWPPSTPFHLSWREAFPEALRRVRENAAEIDRCQGKRERVLLVAPTRGCMERFKPREAQVLNEHNGAGVPETPAGRVSREFNELVERCYRAGLLYDVTEESVLENLGQICKDSVRVGKAEYRHVIMGNGCVFRDPDTVQRLVRFRMDLPPEAASEGVKSPKPVGRDDTPWRALPEGENQILLSFSDGVCELPVSGDVGEPRLWSSDPVRELTVEKIGDVLRVRVEPLAGGEQEPFVFLRGSFLVKSLSPYVHRNGQLYTEGPFALTCPGETDAEALVETGFPFRVEPVILEKTVRVPEGASSLTLAQFSGAAVRLKLGEGSPTWIFSVSDKVTVPLEYGGRRVKLRAELYPSTFNAYGPHHHVDGDRHLVSPDQYNGKKNFADSSDAPEYTRVHGWSFVPLSLQTGVVFSR